MGGGQYGLWAYGAAFNAGVSLGCYALIISAGTQFGNNIKNDILLDGANFGTFGNNITGNYFFPSAGRPDNTYACIKLQNIVQGGNNIVGNVFYSPLAPNPLPKYGVEIIEASPGTNSGDLIDGNTFEAPFGTAFYLPAVKTVVGTNMEYPFGANLGNILNVGMHAQAFSSLATPGPGQGGMAVVTDSTTNVWGATISGGGGDIVLAFWNGTTWTVAGK